MSNVTPRKKLSADFKNTFCNDYSDQQSLQVEYTLKNSKL